MRVTIIDNYDSFTYNVAHLFGELDVEVDVIRNDASELGPQDVDRSDLLVIGPGPGRPIDSGKSMQLIAHAVATRHPLFGICLGQQAIGEFFGGKVDYAPSLMHGKVSAITHNGKGVFSGLPSPFEATRYHSLCVSQVDFPLELEAIAWSGDGVVQGLMHRTLPIQAVQFHPESILTAPGKEMFRNMLQIAQAAKTQAVRTA